MQSHKILYETAPTFAQFKYLLFALKIFSPHQSCTRVVSCVEADSSLAMPFNISDLDEDLYFAVNTAMNVSLFGIIVLPPLVLCLLCIVALYRAENINLKIKVLLINLLLGETVSWFAYTFLYLTFPIKAQLPMEYEAVCSIGISGLILVAVFKFPATALYAMNVLQNEIEMEPVNEIRGGLEIPRGLENHRVLEIRQAFVVPVELPTSTV